MTDVSVAALGDQGVWPGQGPPYCSFLRELESSDLPQQSWDEIAAGLMVLRHADSRLAGTTPIGVAPARVIVERLPDSCFTKAELRLLLVAVEEVKSRQDRRRVMRRKWKYARRLEFQGAWLRASDVYESILPQLPIRAERRRVTCMIRIGLCHKWAASYQYAARMFRESFRAARKSDDRIAALRAQCSMAEVILVRGNIPKAELIMRRVARLARRYRSRALRMRALHALGAASYIREQYERALHLEYRALRLSRAGEYRWRVWADLGNVLIGLGTYDLARRVFVLVAGHTEQELLRWGCTYSLLEIGSLRQDHDVIERYAPTLLATAAFPYQQAHAYGLLGDCYQRRGDTKTAREYFRRAIAVAEEHGIQQLAFQSQESLQRSVESLPPSSSLVLDGIEMELHSAEMTARG